MRWVRIARKDIRDAIRTRTLLIVVALFALIGGAMGYLSTTTGEPSTLAETLPLVAVGSMTLFVPIVALGVSYESIVGPRTSGALQFLLGLPYSRGDYALGTYVGRATIVAVGVLSAFVALAVGAGVRGIVVSPSTTLLACLLVVALGVVFVAIGLSISLSARSTGAAGALAFGAFLVLFFFWSSLPGAIAYLANGFSAPETLPGWAPYVRSLNPVASVQLLLDYVAGPATSAGGFVGVGVDSPTLAVAVVLGWMTVVPAVAFRRFRDDDL